MKTTQAVKNFKSAIAFAEKCANGESFSYFLRYNAAQIEGFAQCLLIAFQRKHVNEYSAALAELGFTSAESGYAAMRSNSVRLYAADGRCVSVVSTRDGVKLGVSKNAEDA